MKKKKYWQIDTEKLARRISEVARNAHTEEDLKMGVEPLFQKTFQEMGIDTNNVRYEETATMITGRSDAVYGYLTLEYKAPGKFERKVNIETAVQQLQRYLTGKAQQFGGKRDDFLEKAVGVAIDGVQILFVRFTKRPAVLQMPLPVTEGQTLLFAETTEQRGFHVMGPYPISSSSLANFLIFVRASARLPLTADNLASVFSPNCQVTQQAISDLYSALVKAQSRRAPSRVKTFFVEWDRIFGVVYGEELEKAEKSAAETAKVYQMPAGIRLKQLLFSIHTFYAFLMKLISIELISLQDGMSVKSFLRGLSALDDTALRERLIYLENGADFSSAGITNYLEADFFSWYLDGWNSHLANVFREILNALSDFEPATPILEPEWTRDLLQRLYELLVPRQLRHALGEYYTPDWLAGYVVDRSGYDGKSGSRFLDPACGSGTFLVQAINKAMGITRRNHEAVAKHILENIVGFDLNPIAVLAARTNYLIAFSRLIPHIRPISIPVYLCDSILTPSRYVEEGELPFEDNTVVFTTTKANYTFPVAMKDKKHIDEFTAMIDLALGGDVTPDKFRGTIERAFKLTKEEISLLVHVYEHIKKLEDRGENGIWARYIKNAFAPVYLGQFDFVIGNPPWIRWGYLSDEYRRRTLALWKRYGLFSLKGHAARLGAGEKDFSMLFTYACADNYLKKGGELGFLITMEVFKSKGAGEGFRRFELNDEKTPLRVLSMEDMVHLQPFHSANKTSLFFMKKGEKTKYPVKVTEWKRKKGVGRIPTYWSLEEVKANCHILKLKAKPIDPDKSYSSWQTATGENLKRFDKIKGDNYYRAYRGASTEPYGVYWLRVNEVRPDGIVVIENMHNRGKREIKPVKTAIEPDLIFPSVSGGDLVKFGIKSHDYVLVSQNPSKRIPFEEGWMIENVPLTYAYLKQFQGILLSRGSRVVRELAEKTSFYAMYGIGEYTFAKYRVIWKRMASRMCAVVLSTFKTEFGSKKLISTDTTAFFAVGRKDEAHYLCAVLNSELINSYIKSFSSAGRGFGAPSVMKELDIPKFDKKNSIHKNLVDLSIRAHHLVKSNKSCKDEQAQIDTLVRSLWNT